MTLPASDPATIVQFMERRRAVLILMGSDSDLPVMRQAADALGSLGIAAELHISSAHRSPEATIELARTARERGFSAIIAGAGLAAHLPGVVASVTTLPVIGVPLDSGALRGQDALLAIVQMPPGVPVATVGIGAARNAGLLAAQVVGAHDETVAARLEEFKQELAQGVAAKDAALQRELSLDAAPFGAAGDGAPPAPPPSPEQPRHAGATST